MTGTSGLTLHGDTEPEYLNLKAAGKRACVTALRVSPKASHPLPALGETVAEVTSPDRSCLQTPRGRTPSAHLGMQRSVGETNQGLGISSVSLPRGSTRPSPLPAHTSPIQGRSRPCETVGSSSSSCHSLGRQWEGAGQAQPQVTGCS